jgi:hypothetical protein
MANYCRAGIKSLRGTGINILDPQHWTGYRYSIWRRAKWYNTTDAYVFAWVARLQYLGVDIAVEVA